MLNYETLLSSYDDKLTLMQWLKKVETDLKDASAIGFSVSNNEDGTINFKIEFEDGSAIESNNISLLNGNILVNGNIDVEGDIVGGVNTEQDKKYKIVACVIRNYGGQWRQIDGAHAPINISNVDNNPDLVQVTFAFTAKNVVSFTCTPDEDFCYAGITCGASVSDTAANIYLYQEQNRAGYFSWNGSSFNVVGDLIESVSMDTDTGVITIHHGKISTLGRNAFVRNGVYIACIGSSGDYSTTITLKDYNGNTILQPNSDWKVYFNITGKPAALNPAEAPINGNIWCFGIMEVE